MYSNFCPLCGIIIPRVRRVVAGQAAVPPLEWYQELRVVRSVEGVSSPFVSGIGFRSFNGLVTAHSDYNVKYTDSNAHFTEEDTYSTLYESFQFWAFPLHNACWEIILHRLKHRTTRPHIVAEHLFYVLLSVIWNESKYLIKEYDYGEAIQFHRGNLEAFRTTTDHGHLSYFKADPCQVHGFEATANTANQFHHGSEDLRISCRAPQPHEEFLSLLPMEIIHMILTWLPSNDVCNLRMASRWVAAASTMEALPQTFWSSRFDPGHEMEFALPYVTGVGQFIDWCQNYLAIKHTLQSPDGFGPLRHRKRIWRAITPICRMVEPLLINGNRRGLVTAWDNISPLSILGDLSGITAGRVFRCLSIAGNYPYLLFEGCREIETRSLLWPQLAEPRVYTIGISLVSLTNGTFVSGVRFLKVNEPNHSQSSLGLINEASETLINVKCNVSFKGFEVAVCPEGIVGLKPILTGSNSVEQKYIGRVSRRRPGFAFGIGFGRLTPRHGKRIFALSAGMDACKLTSIGLIEADQYPECPGMLGKLKLTEKPVTIEDILWTPSIPPRGTSVQVFPASMCDGKFQPLLNIDFGGTDGSRLNSLTRVVAYMSRVPQLIRGFEFFYSDSGSKSYGETGFLERSFFVDGPRGERIVEVNIQLRSERKYIDTIQSLVISTNWGNSVTFAYPEVTTTEELPPLEVLRAPEGEEVTGFIVGMGIRVPVFHSFGLQTRCISPSKVSMKPAEEFMPIIPDPIVYAAETSVASSIHQFSYGTLFSRAFLKDVRCIRFSKGISGRLRADAEISGLWIEYHIPTPPVIVGQWFADIGSFNLSENEEVIEISTWLSRERKEAIDGPQLGKVVGISVSTSLQRSTGYIGTRKENAMKLKFQTNRFEKLSIIMWAYNIFADHLRVFTERIGPHDLILCPKGSPSWIVPEKIFLDNTDGENLDGLDKVQIYSKPGAIIGLSFVYISGVVRGIGRTEGVIESFEARGRRFTGLQVHSTKDIIKELTFHTEPVDADQDEGQPAFLKMKSHTFIASNTGEPPPPNHSMYDLLETQKPRVQHASTRSTHYIHNKEQIPAARTSFIGLWGVGDELRKLGVILRNCDV